MPYTLGVDIGTFESKGVLVDESGAIIARATAPHEMLVPKPGWAEHRPDEDWWGDFVDITKALLKQSAIDPAEIKCIACSAIGPCMLPVDDEGNPLTNGVLYGVDGRAAKEIDQLNARIGEDIILARCGNALTSQSVGPKILWLKNNHPDIFARTAKILTSTSYLVFKLTGHYVIDHYTAANFSPFYDVDELDWCFDLADDVIKENQLPELRWSDELIGTVSEQAANETGLAPGTPVTTGTIDAAAEAVSVGVREAGDMMMMYGSTIFMIMPVKERISDARLWYAPWLYKGTHASMAGLATSGTLTHWFRDQLARDLTRKEAFSVLAKEASHSPPGANGLLLLPYFSGERTPIHDPDASGTFFGLNLTHTRGEMYRAMLEGIAYGTNHVIKTYEELGHRPNRLLGVGGGTKNQVWLQATSDISGMDQEICEDTTGASYGNAFLAAVAMGSAKPDDIHAWNPVASKTEAKPNPVYDDQYKLFLELYQSTSSIMSRLKPGDT